MSDAALRVWPALPKATIRPELYGHFAEHLGRCVYEGIWVGAKSRVPHENGVRLDVLAALKHLHAPVLRWPGGCFADDYHWRDGIGPAGQRPTTANVWWKQGEPNEFGTDEFMGLCRALNAAPYICANVGSGSPAEARDWVEYCNFEGDSTLTRKRAENGTPEPHAVKYWGVGNENWGCGGRFQAADYAREYARFASYMKAVDPGIECIACGGYFGDYRNAAAVSWNHDFCAAMPHADLIDHLSLHRYFQRGTATGFSEAEFHGLFADVLTLERDLERTDAVLRYFYPDKPVGIVVDEWGVWHPEATVENGLEQPGTLRDALLAGAVLNCFNRWAHRISMANIAQTINVLQCLAMTDGAHMCLTPTYHVFDMMRPHAHARLLTHELDGPTFQAHPVGMAALHEVPALSVSASLADHKLLVTVANQTAAQDLDTVIEFREAKFASVSGRELNAESPGAHNTFKHPKAVTPKRLKLDASGRKLRHTFPAHSFTALSFTLE